MSKRDRSGKFYQALFAGVDEPGLCERDRDKNIPEILRSMCAAKEFCLLDIGCGLGKVARIAKEQFPKARVFGVDCSARIVERAKGFGPGIDYRVCDEVSLPFEDGFFDYATCRMSIHHYPRIEEHLCEVRRVLKENAIYLIMDIVPEEGEQNRCLNQVFLAAERDAPGDGHVKFYTLAEYEELLGRRGFVWSMWSTGYSVWRGRRPMIITEAFCLI